MHIERPLFRLVLCLSALLLASCVNYDNYYKLDTGYLARRSVETRMFETQNDSMVITSSVLVLQDLGFAVQETSVPLGLLTAQKTAEAGPSAAAKVFLILFGGRNARYDQSQNIYVTLVISRRKNLAGSHVRVNFSRIVRDNQGFTRAEVIDDVSIYKNFFEKSSQSMFITGYDI